jgi:hypothetical protein
MGCLHFSSFGVYSIGWSSMPIGFPWGHLLGCPQLATQFWLTSPKSRMKATGKDIKGQDFSFISPITTCYSSITNTQGARQPATITEGHPLFERGPGETVSTQSKAPA